MRACYSQQPARAEPLRFCGRRGAAPDGGDTTAAKGWDRAGGRGVRARLLPQPSAAVSAAAPVATPAAAPPSVLVVSSALAVTLRCAAQEKFELRLRQALKGPGQHWGTGHGAERHGITLLHERGGRRALRVAERHGSRPGGALPLQARGEDVRGPLGRHSPGDQPPLLLPATRAPSPAAVGIRVRHGPVGGLQNLAALR
jgi:hypothetical protein